MQIVEAKTRVYRYPWNEFQQLFKFSAGMAQAKNHGMPNFIGASIDGSTLLAPNLSGNGITRIRLSYSQACLLPASEISCSLVTTDKGSKGSRAKRWYRWFASCASILACSSSTPKMRAAALAVQSAAFASSPLAGILRTLVAAGAVQALSERGLLTKSASSPSEMIKDDQQIIAVGADLLMERGVELTHARNLVNAALFWSRETA